jgi:tetratricopeptide (TPR) repeat protein
VGFFLPEIRGTRHFEHSGFNAGYTCHAWASLDGDFGLVIMTNGERGLELMAELERAIWVAYGWPGAPQPVERVALDAAGRARLAGRYTGLGEPFTIDAGGERVWLRRPFLPDVELVTIAGGAVVHRDNGLVLRPRAGGLDVALPDGGTAAVTRLADDVELPLVELAAGRFEHAVKVQQANVAREPASSVEAEARLNGYGYMLLQRGDAANAVQVFRLAAAAFPASANAQDSLGDALAAAGDTAAAITAYQQALAFLPKDTHIAPGARAAITADTPVKLARLRAAPAPR